MNYNEKILKETGIFVFEKALSAEFCQEIIQDFYNNEKKHFKGKTTGGLDLSYKNTIDFHIENQRINETVSQVLTIAKDKIFSFYGILKKEALEMKFCGLQFQKNEKGKGYFRWHSDTNILNDHRRVLAPIIYLNNVEEGGETSFKYQGIKIKPEQGKIVVFPCTWTFFHRGEIPISNDKYIVTTFGIL